MAAAGEQDGLLLQLQQTTSTTTESTSTTSQAEETTSTTTIFLPGPLEPATPPDSCDRFNIQPERKLCSSIDWRLDKEKFNNGRCDCPECEDEDFYNCSFCECPIPIRTQCNQLVEPCPGSLVSGVSALDPRCEAVTW